MKNFILSAIFLFAASCGSNCDNFALEKYSNDNFCKEKNYTDDDCIRQIENDFLKNYGMNSSQYLEMLHANPNATNDKKLIEKFGAYLLGVSAIYNDYSSFEYFLKAGVNPYLAIGTPSAGVLFIIQSKDMKMWQLVTRYYPVDAYHDSMVVESFLVKCGN